MAATCEGSMSFFIRAKTREARCGQRRALATSRTCAHSESTAPVSAHSTNNVKFAEVAVSGLFFSELPPCSSVVSSSSQGSCQDAPFSPSSSFVALFFEDDVCAAERLDSLATRSHTSVKRSKYMYSSTTCSIATLDTPGTATCRGFSLGGGSVGAACSPLPLDSSSCEPAAKRGVKEFGVGEGGTAAAGEEAASKAVFRVGERAATKAAWAATPCPTPSRPPPFSARPSPRSSFSSSSLLSNDEQRRPRAVLGTRTQSVQAPDWSAVWSPPSRARVGRPTTNHATESLPPSRGLWTVGGKAGVCGTVLEGELGEVEGD
mmetsp:Transcript_84754/g.169635  ORF Transcript_84754/g.169635 Transcript_84754/m.169635 type:complete len:319 (+) Transcript_84754:1285-2241(+)